MDSFKFFVILTLLSIDNISYAQLSDDYDFTLDFQTVKMEKLRNRKNPLDMELTKSSPKEIYEEFEEGVEEYQEAYNRFLLDVATSKGNIKNVRDKWANKFKGIGLNPEIADEFVNTFKEGRSIENENAQAFNDSIDLKDRCLGILKKYNEVAEGKYNFGKFSEELEKKMNSKISQQANIFAGICDFFNPPELSHGDDKPISCYRDDASVKNNSPGCSDSAPKIENPVLPDTTPPAPQSSPIVDPTPAPVVSSSSEAVKSSTETQLKDKSNTSSPEDISAFILKSWEKYIKALKEDYKNCMEGKDRLNDPLTKNNQENLRGRILNQRKNLTENLEKLRGLLSKEGSQNFPRNIPFTENNGDFQRTDPVLLNQALDKKTDRIGAFLDYYSRNENADDPENTEKLMKLLDQEKSLNLARGGVYRKVYDDAENLVKKDQIQKDPLLKPKTE